MSDLVAAFFGARGQGKSTLAKALLAHLAPRRLLIFDPMDEYDGQAERVAELRALLARVRAERSFGLRYVPPSILNEQLAARFDALCSIAYDARDVCLLVEELQLVTRPSWAPPAWAECTLRGRHRGVAIVGLSQRPALVDKNFLGNCTRVSTCRLNFEDDVLTLARLLGVPRERVAALARWHWISRDMDTGQVSEGVTLAPGAAPRRRRK